MSHIPELKEFRYKARLSQSQLARDANLDRATISRAENGYDTREMNCHSIIDALNETKAFKDDPISYEAVVDGGLTGPFPVRKKPTAEAPTA